MRRKRRGRRRRRRRGRRRRRRRVSRALYEIGAVDDDDPLDPPSWKRMLLPLPMTTHGRRSRAARRRTAASASGVRTSTRNRAGPPTPSVQWSARDAPSSRRTSPSASRGSRARHGDRRGAPRVRRRPRARPGGPGRTRRRRGRTTRARPRVRRLSGRRGGAGRRARARVGLARPSSGGTPPRLPSARVPGPRRIADGEETARRETGSIARLHEGGRRRVSTPTPSRRAVECARARRPRDAFFASRDV